MINAGVRAPKQTQVVTPMPSARAQADSLRVVLPATPVSVIWGAVPKAHSAVTSEPWVESNT